MFTACKQFCEEHWFDQKNCSVSAKESLSKYVLAEENLTSTVKYERKYK